MKTAPPIMATPEQWELLESLMNQLAPDAQVLAFGSRVNGKAKRTSDLDLALIAAPGCKAQADDLREALEESDLPFRVDLHLWSQLPREFQTQILATGIEIKPSA